MSLPIFQTDDKDLHLMQTNWSAQLNPVLASPLANARIISNVLLINGVTTINHQLGTTLQGWFIVRINGSATIFDNQASNPTPALTLILQSNSPVTVNVAVF